MGQVGVIPVHILRSMMGMIRGDIHFEVFVCVECVWMMERYVWIIWWLSQECVLLPVGIWSFRRSVVVIWVCLKLAMGVEGFWGNGDTMFCMGGCMVGMTIVVEGSWWDLWWDGLVSAWNRGIWWLVGGVSICFFHS